MFYKLRAECSQDVINFIANAHSQMHTFSMIKEDPSFPDCELIFETELELDEIILTLKDIDDSHVMYQTVKRLTEYTGERDYSID